MVKSVKPHDEKETTKGLDKLGKGEKNPAPHTRGIKFEKDHVMKKNKEVKNTPLNKQKDKKDHETKQVEEHDEKEANKSKDFGKEKVADGSLAHEGSPTAMEKRREFLRKRRG
jgi:hypothetical protein